MVPSSVRNWIAINAVQQSSLNKNMTTLHLRNSISRSPVRRGFPVVVLALALAFVALPQMAPAVTPAPDGGYPNGNTAEGDGALQGLTTGPGNMAIGFEALFSQQPSKFVFKDASGRATSVDVVDKYQPNKIVRPIAKIDGKLDPKLTRAATIAEEAFEWLDAPLVRLASLDTPVPYSPPLEDYYLPQTKDVVEATRKLAAY